MQNQRGDGAKRVVARQQRAVSWIPVCTMGFFFVLNLGLVAISSSDLPRAVLVGPLPIWGILLVFCMEWLTRRVVGDTHGLHVRLWFRARFVPWGDITDCFVTRRPTGERLYVVETTGDPVAWPLAWEGSAALAGWVRRNTPSLGAAAWAPWAVRPNGPWPRFLRLRSPRTPVLATALLAAAMLLLTLAGSWGLCQRAGVAEIIRSRRILETGLPWLLSFVLMLLIPSVALASVAVSLVRLYLRARTAVVTVHRDRLVFSSGSAAVEIPWSSIRSARIIPAPHHLGVYCLEIEHDAGATRIEAVVPLLLEILDLADVMIAAIRNTDPVRTARLVPDYTSRTAGGRTLCFRRSTGAARIAAAGMAVVAAYLLFGPVHSPNSDRGVIASAILALAGWLLLANWWNVIRIDRSGIRWGRGPRGRFVPWGEVTGYGRKPDNGSPYISTVAGGRIEIGPMLDNFEEFELEVHALATSARPRSWDPHLAMREGPEGHPSTPGVGSD